MDKTFDHQAHEGKIYNLWNKSGAFTPLPTKHKEPFTIIMPPPNANDPLHIGHARFVTIEDTLIRFNRMRGIPTLWLPGSDHAGIETQFVFEKKLKERGKSRFDFDRQTLYKMIWDYVDDNTNTMHSQLMRLGASCDWSRHMFTLDPKIVKIVYNTFKKLYDDGLVYRGERIVNYSPANGTFFSELEVEYREQEDPLYYLDYGPISIATTRPETIFADVAVAVNPKDKKLAKLIGQKAIIPIIEREIPIIGDSLVEADFGTGALKVTPAHDAVDFEIGKKHDLSAISVIDENGRMINTPKKYLGLKAHVARKEVARDLAAKGKLVKEEIIKHTVGYDYKHKQPIEPMVSRQWFIKVEPLARLAMDAIKNKEVVFVDQQFKKRIMHWLRNLKDWNVSRQIVWGIQIPAWQCNKCMEWIITDGTKPNDCNECHGTKLTQDTDTFDTWFSSGQWPFAALLANSKKDLDYFYPTSVMNTASDILFYWVSRMIMLGVYKMDNVPFKDVLMHGLVRDKNGDKISKSKGNVIDPIEMTDRYGADALRMSLIWGANVESDISLSEDTIRGQRNFANKLWNVARFISYDNKLTYVDKKPRSKNKNDQLILEKLAKTSTKITKLIEKYKLNDAATELYNFIWNDFASTYLESAKSRKAEALPTLTYVLQNSLALAHPFMPFVTEAIWQEVLDKKPSALITYSWPK